MNNEIVVIENNQYILNNEFASSIAELERAAKEIKKQQDSIKEQIKKTMEEKNILSLKDEINGISITYTPEQTNLEKFDSKKFKEENPDLYDSYVTLDGKKSSFITIRIK